MEEVHSINLKEFIDTKLNEIKPNLCDELLNHPRFVDSFTKELMFIVSQTSSDDVEVVTSFDRKTVTINSYNALQYCSVDKLKGDNKAFISSKLFINNDNLYVDYSEGTLYDRKKLEESGIRILILYNTKLETLYTLKCFNKYGVEYSNSSYSDTYLLSKNIRDIDLREQTLSSFHKPTFYEYMLPKGSIHVFNAKARNTYRKEGSYAIIHTNIATITRDGYKDTACSLFTTHSLYPELLRGEKAIAKAVEHDGQFTFIIEEEYAPSIEKAYEKAEKELRENLEKRKNEIDPQAYDYLINNL